MSFTPRSLADSQKSNNSRSTKSSNCRSRSSIIETYVKSVTVLLLSYLPFYVQHYIRLALAHLPEQYRLPTGTCSLVGAGPGHRSLLTLRAHDAIRNADIVISDRLVPQPILNLVRGRILHLPRTACARSDDAQENAYEWMLNQTVNGLRVVRLKGGDPFVFGRGGEEVLYLLSRGISRSQISVIPGISSSIAAGESAWIPVTHRGLADQFLVITGRGEGGRVPDIPSFTPRRTVVVMMGMGRLSMLVSSFIEEAKYPRHTPVAVIHKATWTDQRTVKGTLETIERVVELHNITNPAVIYVGNVVTALEEGNNLHHKAFSMASQADEGIDVGI